MHVTKRPVKEPRDTRKRPTDRCKPQDAARLDGAKVSLPALPNDLSQRVNRIVGRIRENRAGGMPLYTVRQGGAAEQKVLALMAEDR